MQEGDTVVFEKQSDQLVSEKKYKTIHVDDKIVMVIIKK